MSFVVIGLGEWSCFSGLVRDSLHAKISSFQAIGPTLCNSEGGIQPDNIRFTRDNDLVTKQLSRERQQIPETLPRPQIKEEAETSADVVVIGAGPT